jgi:hypothetical protein
MSGRSWGQYYYGGSAEIRVVAEIEELRAHEKKNNRLYAYINTDTSLSSALRSLGIHPVTGEGVLWIELLLECGINSVNKATNVNIEKLKSKMRRIIGDGVLLKIEEGAQSTPQRILEKLQKTYLLHAYLRGVEYQPRRLSKQRIQPGMSYRYDKSDITTFIRDLVGKNPDGDYNLSKPDELWMDPVWALFTRVCASIEESDTFRPALKTSYRAVVHVIYDRNSYFFRSQEPFQQGQHITLVCEFVINSKEHALFLTKLWWPTKLPFLDNPQTSTASTDTSETTDTSFGSHK